MTKDELIIHLEYLSQDILDRPLYNALEGGQLRGPLKDWEKIERFSSACQSAKEHLIWLIEEVKKND